MSLLIVSRSIVIQIIGGILLRMMAKSPMYWLDDASSAGSSWTFGGISAKQVTNTLVQQVKNLPVNRFLSPIILGYHVYIILNISIKLISVHVSIYTDYVVGNGYICVLLFCHTTLTTWHFRFPISCPIAANNLGISS